MNKNIHASMLNRLKENPDYAETRDEFYTTPETAQRMIEGLKLSQFAGKSVYCNCDTENRKYTSQLRQTSRLGNLNRLSLLATSKAEKA